MGSCALFHMSDMSLNGTFAITDEILDGIFAEEDIVRERTRNPSKSEEIRSFVRNFHSNFLRYCNTKFSSLFVIILFFLSSVSPVPLSITLAFIIVITVSVLDQKYKWGIAMTTN